MPHPLEALVASLERLMMPEGLTLTTNRIVRSSSGTALAELDVEISGTLDGELIHWLFECRDRPSEGKAPGAWIEQLYGRRHRFNLTRVVAVSTTGFSEGAVDFASTSGIELHDVVSLDPSRIADWLPIRELTIRVPELQLHALYLRAAPGTPSSLIDAMRTIAVSESEPLRLISTLTGSPLTLELFANLTIQQAMAHLNRLPANQPPVGILLRADISDSPDGAILLVPSVSTPIEIAEFGFGLDASVSATTA